MKISFSQYMSQLKKVLPMDDKIVLDKFTTAYDLYNGLSTNSNSSTNNTEVANELLSYLYNTNSNFCAIPMEFINSPVGTVLFSLKFGVPEPEFTTSQIEIIAGISRSLISRDLDNDKIVAYKQGRNIIVTKTNLINYMKSKGFSYNESIEKINAFQNKKN